MSSATGYILRLSPEREQLLENTREDYFAEPVDEFNHSRSVPLICFLVSSTGVLTWIAKGKRGVRAGTELRRLNLENFYDASGERVHIEKILEHCSSRFKAKLEQRLNDGGLLPPKTFQELLNILNQLAPSADSILRVYSEARQGRIRELSSEARDILGEQKEAVATAMSIAGIDREELLNWDVPDSQAPTSFLDGLSQVRLREDPMVIHDGNVFPGFDAVKTSPHNSVVFEDDQRKLTVVITNRQPLEELLGVDLIYYNETFHSFIFIQYKAMEIDGSEAVFRFQNAQLDIEILRMKGVLSELNKCGQNLDADSYRLSENPFFLKLCPRIVFNPDNTALVKGMYLPLDYWERISQHESMAGPKGGKRISYSNARRYLDNTDFIKIAANAWVGTTINQSAELETVIRSTLESGRAVVLAVCNDKERRHHGRS